MKTDDDLGGNPSLDGWHYQCDVSVLAALDLLVVSRVASILQLEPATQEDLEAELEAPKVCSSTVVDGERLVVQAKLRRSGQWTAATLRSLVAHGKKRPSALKLLEDPKVRYVLFTSADLSGSLGALQVDTLLERPGQEDLPNNVFPTKHVKKAAGRFSVLAQYNEARVVEKINSYLFSPLAVPQHQHQTCLEELRKTAMAGMRNGHAWSRGDVEAIVKKHGGSIPSERDRTFVPPTNWADILAQMDNRNAIFITGPSGTGKTTVAKALYEHYRKVVPGLQYLEPSDPSELKGRPNAGPTLSYVEDPWGKYEIGPNPTEWTAGLEERLLKASPQHMIVVTSRTDILAATVGAESDFLKRWEVRLEAEHYGDRELGRMFENLVRLLSTKDLQLAAIRAKSRVLQELRTPFEIDRFVALLQVGAIPADENEDRFVSRILHDTQTHAIENEVERMIRGRRYVGAAVVLWALLAARGSLRRQDLPTIRRSISKLDASFGHQIESLVNDLVAGGNLRQPNSLVTYMHPRVEQGLMRVVRANPQVTEVTLELLLKALVHLGNSGHSHATETAARLHAFVKDSKEPLYELPDEVQLGIDIWLEDALSRDDAEYAGLLRLASIVGSADCIPAEVARWLRPVATKRSFYMASWSRSSRDEEWYDKARLHPLTGVICKHFIRHVLTTGNRLYPRDMAECLDDIAPGLDSAWLDAARRIIDQECTNSPAIGFGSMQAVAGREPLLQMALSSLRRQSAPQEERSLSDHWAYLDGHFNGDWEEYDDHPDHCHAAREMVAAFVAVTHRDFGWRALAEHKDARDLADDWFDSLDLGDAGDDELKHLLTLGAGGHLEVKIWRRLSKKWRPAFGADLQERLRGGGESENLREIAAGCALQHAPGMLVEAAERLLQEGEALRLLELAYDAKTSIADCDSTDELRIAYQLFEASLPAPFGEIAGALSSLEEVQEIHLSDAALNAIVPLVGKHRSLLRPILVWLVATNGRATEAMLEESLGETDNADAAGIAVRAAAAAGCWHLVTSALVHQRARARMLALELLSNRPDFGDMGIILSLTSDPSSFVRRSLLEILAAQPEHHAAALVELCNDTWSPDSLPPGVDQNYPLARRAAQALATLTSAATDLSDSIIEAAIETDDSSVTQVLLSFLADHGDEDALQKLVELVFSVKPKFYSLLAASAIAEAKQAVPKGSLKRANQSWFKRSPSHLAAQTAEAVGCIADQIQIIALAKSLAAMEGRRALLIPLAIGAACQSIDLANEVLRELPHEHPAKQILESSKTPLPHDVLDELGNARTVEAVRWILGDRILDRPSIMAI